MRINELLLASGQRVFYDYDAPQDMLYVLFRPEIGATYYKDLPDLAGVMLRYDNATNQIVGLTVHNVQRKLLQKLIADIGDQVLPRAA